jgi:hypothetical protein
MRICIRIGGVLHCFYIPIYRIPIHIPEPGPGPVNYPQFFVDASLVGSIHDAASKVSDERVRETLLRGVNDALSALKERGGEHAEEVGLAE